METGNSELNISQFRSITTENTKTNVYDINVRETCCNDGAAVTGKFIMHENDDMINETRKVVRANPIRDTLKITLIPDKGIGRMKSATTSTMRGGKETSREKYDVT